MIKFSELSRAVFGTKIQTPSQLNEIISKRHTPAKIFGINFSPKFKLAQDVFDAAALQELTVPKGITFKFSGKGSSAVPLRIKKDAKFIAPFATFGDTVTEAKNTVIYCVKNLVSTAGKTNVGVVSGNNVATKAARQNISIINGNNEAFGQASQKIHFIEGNNKSYNRSSQDVEFIKGDSDAFDASTQIIGDFKGYVSRHHNASVKLPSHLS